MKRREFFQSFVASVAGILILPKLAMSEERRRGGGDAVAKASLVDPKDPNAKAVNYVEKNTDIKDTKLQTERAGVKFKDQVCVGCAFYQKDKETKVNGKTAAPCQMPFAAGKMVTSTGWCTSWAKK